MFLAEGLDKFFVFFLITVFCKNTQKSLPLIERFGGFMKATSETVIDKSSLQYFLNGSIDVHRASISYGSHWNIMTFDIRRDDKILDRLITLTISKASNRKSAINQLQVNSNTDHQKLFILLMKQHSTQLTCLHRLYLKIFSLTFMLPIFPRCTLKMLKQLALRSLVT